MPKIDLQHFIDMPNCPFNYLFRLFIANPKPKTNYCHPKYKNIGEETQIQFTNKMPHKMPSSTITYPILENKSYINCMSEFNICKFN